MYQVPARTGIHVPGELLQSASGAVQKNPEPVSLLLAPAPDIERARARAPLHDGEVVADREVHRLVAEFERVTVVAAVASHLQHEIARMAAAHRTADRFEVAGDEQVDALARRPDSDRRADELADAIELFARRIGDLDLVRQSPEERLVHELAR